MQEIISHVETFSVLERFIQKLLSLRRFIKCTGPGQNI